MPRASRYFLPGYSWHITHRCHKREFLLKFNRDKRCWLSWLFEAKKRYGLKILNYMVTDNHIHILAIDDGNRECIPRSMQLLAGRTGQEFNHRKKRKGAYWEDRYHATAVAKADYLAQCMDYIDMNMVRAGVVSHPAKWPFCGYSELIRGKKRYRLIDTEKLTEVLGLSTPEKLPASRKHAIESTLQKENYRRDKKWTESIAVGSESFVETIKERLGLRAKSRGIQKDNDTYQLHESINSYNPVLGVKNDALSENSGLIWDVYRDI